MKSLAGFGLCAAFALAPASPAMGEGNQLQEGAAAYGRVLDRFVKNDRVDYKAMKADPRDLKTYLSAAAAVTRSDFNAWTRDQQIAFLINLYNAQTLELISDHYPVRSIKEIGRLFKGPWDRDVVHLFGEAITLGHLEHVILRKEYREPRIHFALVCAALGCPPLRKEPYSGPKLDAQLDDQGRLFMRDPRKNRLDAASGTLRLSPIFQWFKEDFMDQAESLQAFAAPYFPEEQAALLSQKTFEIAFTDYDWSLNAHAAGPR